MKGLFIQGIDAELRQSLIDCGFEPVKQDVYLMVQWLQAMESYGIPLRHSSLGIQTGKDGRNAKCLTMQVTF